MGGTASNATMGVFFGGYMTSSPNNNNVINLTGKTLGPDFSSGSIVLDGAPSSFKGPGIYWNDFFNSINVTGGLPFLRVSPDHGPAFDIAKKNIANFQSLLSSLKFISNFKK